MSLRVKFIVPALALALACGRGAAPGAVQANRGPAAVAQLTQLVVPWAWQEADGVRLTAGVTNDIAVTKVEFQVDGKPAGTAVSRPWSVLATGLLTPGSHTLTARVSDTARKEYFSAPYSFTVEEPTLLNANAGFENELAGWTATSKNWIVDYAQHDSGWSYRGVGYARLGSPGKADTKRLSQVIAIPAGGASLSLAARVQSTQPSFDTYDTLDVEVTSGTQTTRLLRLTNLDEGGYVQRIYDLSAFAGKTVTLSLTSWTGGGEASYTYFYVDEVAVRARKADDTAAPRIACTPTLPSYSDPYDPLGLSVVADDASGIAQAVFLVDGAVVQDKAALVYQLAENHLPDGNHTIGARVADPLGNVAECTIPFGIGADITPPTVLAEVKGALGDIWLHGRGDDVDRVVRVALYVDGKLVQETTSNNEAFLTVTAASLGAGPHELRVEATDDAGNVGRASRVFEAVVPGEADTTGPKVVVSTTLRGDREYVTATATDPSGIVAMQLCFDSQCQSYSGQPEQPYTWMLDLHGLDGTKPHSVEVSAVDGAGNVGKGAATFTFPARFPPFVDAGADQTVLEGDPITLHAEAYDPEGSAVTLGWTQTGGPTVTLTGADTTHPTFTAPEVAERTVLTFVAAAVDADRQSSSDTVQVAVENSPGAPVAEAGPNQTVNGRATVTLAGSGTDSDGRIAAYAWEQVDGPPVTLSDPASAAPTFVAPDVTADAVLDFQLTVTDDRGLHGRDTVSVTVKYVPPPNDAPVASAGQDVTIVEGASVVLHGTATDADGTVKSYAWMQISGPDASKMQGTDTPDLTVWAPADVAADTAMVFRLTVTDDHGAKGTDSVWVNVKNVTPVEVSAGSDLFVREGETVTLAGTVADPDGLTKTLRWTCLSDPTVAILDDRSATASFVAPEVTADATYIFELAVEDVRGLEVTDEVLVTVKNANKVPVVSAGGDRTVKGGAMVQLSASATDPDGTVISYAWTQTSGPTVRLVNATSPGASFTAPGGTADTVLTFKVTVTDDQGGQGTDTVVVTVTEKANQLPAVSAGTDLAVDEGVAVTLTASASDPDGTVAGHAWAQTGGPTVKLTGATSASASFTAPAVTADTALTFQVTVTDDRGGQATDTVQVTVRNRNQLPTVDAGADLTVNEEAAVQLGATASDADGTVKTYAWKQVSGVTVSLSGANGATPGFTAPTVTADSVLTFEVTVTDDQGGKAADTVSVTVKHATTANQPPSASAGPDQTVQEGAAVSLAATASDPDGTIAAYAWKQTGGPAVSLSGATTAIAAFTAPAVDADAALTFQVTVTDDRGATASDTVEVKVTDEVPPANQAPTASAGSDRTVDEGTLVVLAGSGSDPDGSITAWSWKQTGGPAVTLADAAMAKATFTAPAVNADAALTFELTVTDDRGATASDAVQVTVHHVTTPPENQPPTVNAGADQTTAPDTGVTLSATASDADGSVVRYAWVQTGGPEVALDGASSSSPTFTAPAVEVDTVLAFQLTVTDDQGATATDTVLVTVEAHAGSGGQGGGGGGCATGGGEASALGLLLSLGALRRVRRRGLKPARHAGTEAKLGR